MKLAAGAPGCPAAARARLPARPGDDRAVASRRLPDVSRRPARRLGRHPAPRQLNQHHTITREQLSVREHMSIVLRRRRAALRALEDLFDTSRGPQVLVVTFIGCSSWRGSTPRRGMEASRRSTWPTSRPSGSNRAWATRQAVAGDGPAPACPVRDLDVSFEGDHRAQLVGHHRLEAAGGIPSLRFLVERAHGAAGHDDGGQAAPKRARSAPIAPHRCGLLEPVVDDHSSGRSAAVGRPGPHSATLSKEECARPSPAAAPPGRCAPPARLLHHHDLRPALA